MTSAENIRQEDLLIDTLGECTIDSPLGPRKFTPDNHRVLFDIVYEQPESGTPEGPPTIGFEKSGSREKIYFDPAKSKAAIITCGGLCPGLNNVVRQLYYTLSDAYGVPEVYGIRHGYKGLVSTDPHLQPMLLKADDIELIHHQGGTLLGTSRGPQDPVAMVDRLCDMGVNLFFPIGGDGTQRGAHAIAEEAKRRGVDLSVVGIPKTIDNDIQFCFQTFGFMSAVAEAERVIDRAHIEAKSVERGIGLVKLMGREAGFIAAAATIASGEVNFTLVPEIPLQLEGPDGFLEKLRLRMEKRGHAIIVIAEGAGQSLLEGDHKGNTDASGNKKLGDIGPYMKERIIDHFKEIGQPIGMKYFDPSYYIRSVHAGAFDSLLTERFARHAVHAAMAGKTNMIVGNWNGRIVHVPLSAIAGRHRRLSTDSELWSAVLATTQQENW